MSRTTRSALVGCLVLAAGPAQSAADLVPGLLRPAERTRTLGQLRQLGPEGARAVFAAWQQRRQAKDATAGELLTALAELGPASAPMLPELIAAVPECPEPPRSSLLRALANGLLDASDEHAARLADQLPAWAAAGVFYSPAADAPTFAWYEYVRLCRRLAVRGGRTDARVLSQALERILGTRSSLGVLGGMRDVPDVHDLSAFGQHATREELEAIAELAGRGTAPTDVVTELANYLRCEPPRPGIVLTEHCAGIGENAPVDAPAVQFPTHWRRDDWRFAIARVTVRQHPDADGRLHGLRHLLHADTAAERIEALALARTWPRPWAEFVPDLVANLDHADRLVVREALTVLALAGRDGAAAKDRLTVLSAGADREFAQLAKNALRAMQ